MSIEDCPTYPITWTEGDQLPEIGGVLEDTDITGWTITLTLERPDSAVPAVLTKTATIVDAVNGQFNIAWDATDLVAGVNQLAVLRFENAGGLKLTPQRFRIDVLEVPA